MIVTTIGNLLRGRFSVVTDQREWKRYDFRQDWFSACYFEGHCIYMFLDEGTIFYIGQSKQRILYRIGNHLGLYLLPGSMALQRFIGANRPSSYDWQIRCLTPEDCLQFYDIPNACDATVDSLEQRMIKRYSPCLNIAHNPRPRPIPGHYHLPFSEILDGVVCSGGQDGSYHREYQISYQAYDFVSQQNKHYTIKMHAKSFSECHQMIDHLLGYKPEHLRIKVSEQNETVSFVERETVSSD